MERNDLRKTDQVGIARARGRTLVGLRANTISPATEEGRNDS